MFGTRSLAVGKALNASAAMRTLVPKASISSLLASKPTKRVELTRTQKRNKPFMSWDNMYVPARH